MSPTSTNSKKNISKNVYVLESSPPTWWNEWSRNHEKVPTVFSQKYILTLTGRS